MSMPTDVLPGITITDPGVTAPTDPLTAPTPTGRLFTEAEIATARQQEKDKLYGRIAETTAEGAAAKAERDALLAERQAQLDAVEKQRLDAEASARATAETEMSAKDLVEVRHRELQEKFARLEQERAEERSLFQKEREFGELREYAQAQARANENEIAPELLDLIAGNSREEIDASVTLMKAKSSAIVQSMAAAQQQALAGQPRGASLTGRPNIGPLDSNPSSRTLSPADISNMTMAEYARIRPQLLGAAQDQVRARGLYG